MATETNTLLKMYLVKGTIEVSVAVSRSKKLRSVGLCTKNRGGYRNSSSSGLNAVETMYTIGSAVNETSASMNKYNRARFNDVLSFSARMIGIRPLPLTRLWTKTVS
ncbi:hypothetical protein [Paenibacillus alginolyticus]|uniref:Uncharacterized protein n=1 Tax=Paenibacillus alginolyticus TaxID=59839 RepID=A0ABT4GCD6_9BACL|nr:hypothetical protein [Paenibacillus alginolyticus]MCY9693857.1 hypothetical protein [Paenibacillus alginolyticus]MEC0148192.1 hypothetical protein [Paenibacillus alginolyticus]